MIFAVTKSKAISRQALLCIGDVRQDILLSLLLPELFVNVECSNKWKLSQKAQYTLFGRFIFDTLSTMYLVHVLKN